jgi:tripartite-type tricarboxylate transporter receptor subunit TctC
MEKVEFRLFVFALAVSLATAGFLCASNAKAEYPERPITMLVAFSPGGSMDIAIRTISASAEKYLGKPIAVDNRGGGGGTVAPAVVANAKPDGYTLCGATTSGLIRAPLMQKVTFKPLRSFTPIIGFATPQNAIIVAKDSSFKNLKELLDYAKKNPNKIKYSTTGPGSSQHHQMELLAHDLGIKWIHVPYKGTQDAITALLGGHVDVCSAGPEWVPAKRSELVRVLAVSQEKRSPNFPEIPTLKELGYPTIDEVIFSIVGPAGMSPQVVHKLESAFARAMDSQEFKNMTQKLDLIPVCYKSTAYEQYLKMFWARCEKTMKETGIIKEAATSPY